MFKCKMLNDDISKKKRKRKKEEDDSRDHFSAMFYIL